MVFWKAALSGLHSLWAEIWSTYYDYEVYSFHYFLVLLLFLALFIHLFTFFEFRHGNPMIKVWVNVHIVPRRHCSDLHMKNATWGAVPALNIIAWGQTPVAVVLLSPPCCWLSKPESGLWTSVCLSIRTLLANKPDCSSNGNSSDHKLSLFGTWFIKNRTIDGCYFSHFFFFYLRLWMSLFRPILMISSVFFIAFSYLLHCLLFTLEIQHYFSKTVGRKDVEKMTFYLHITRSICASVGTSFHKLNISVWNYNSQFHLTTQRVQHTQDTFPVSGFTTP